MSVSMGGLDICGLSFSYGERQIISDLSLDAARGEIVAVMGESGSGKTTLARLISGFLLPANGTISVDGETLHGPSASVPAHRRGIGLVPQEGALFPHLNVADNVGFGLDRRDANRQPRISECLELVGLAGFEKRRPAQLSGGQQQRVSVARALAPRPRLIILDEPFSALDAALRRTTRDEVFAALRTSGATVVFVTHDSQEALSSADRVAALDCGRVAQFASPADIYDAPATRAIAESCGPLAALAGTVSHAGLITALGSIDRTAVPTNVGTLTAGTTGTAHIRPELIEIATTSADGFVQATVLNVAIDGPDAWATCILDNSAGEAIVRIGRGRAPIEGNSIWLKPHSVTLFVPD